MKLYIFEYEETLFCYKAFIIAENKEKANESVKRVGGDVDFVRKHNIKSGLILEGGGNG